jgi:uncharacterized membrane protein YoaK (UPF0700 family)
MKIILVFLLLAFSIIGASMPLQAASSTQTSKAPSPSSLANPFLGNWKQTVKKLTILFPEKKSKAAIIYLSLAILFAVGAAALYTGAGADTKLATLALLLGIIAIAFMLLWLIRVMTGGRPLF